MDLKPDLQQDSHLPSDWLVPDFVSLDSLTTETAYAILSAMDEAGAEKRPLQTIGALRLPVRHPSDFSPH
jgi:hypothetical protein